MHLVDNHVLQLLVVNRSEVGICLVRLSGDSRGKHVFTRIIESVFDQQTRHVFHFRTTETGLRRRVCQRCSRVIGMVGVTCPILQVAGEHSRLPGKQLDHLADSPTESNG
jgi:hypothetical protein